MEDRPEEEPQVVVLEEDQPEEAPADRLAALAEAEVLAVAQLVGVVVAVVVVGVAALLLY